MTAAAVTVIVIAALVAARMALARPEPQEELSDEALRTLQDALAEWDNRLVEAARRGMRPLGAASGDPRTWPRHRWPETVARVERARAELAAIAAKRGCERGHRRKVVDGN